MIHSDLPWTGIRRSPVKGIQFARDSMLSCSNLGAEAELMISLKRKYIEKYLELQEVADDLWDLTEFFMSHNIKLEGEDRVSFYSVLHKAGSTLPSLHHLASCVRNFIKNFQRFSKTVSDNSTLNYSMTKQSRIVMACVHRHKLFFPLQ